MSKFILDVDTGIDDTLSIAYMLSKKDIEILGITSVYGNVDVTSAAHNSAAILDLFKQTTIPVYKGMEYAFNKDNFSQQRGGAIFHGVNGIGEVSFNTDCLEVVEDSAITFLINMANLHENEITLVASGPLTNIATAIKQDPLAMSKYKRIVLMGGALSVPGNVSPFAEANISQDATAAKIVFESGIPVTMIGLDVTSRAIISREDIKHWLTKSETSKTLYQIMDHYFKAHELIYPSWGGAAMHDPLAAMVALHDNIVKTITIPATVIDDEKQNGRTILDLSRIDDQNNHTVSVAIDLDVDAFKKELITSIDSIL